jgi:FkbM family methyltransferase
VAFEINSDLLADLQAYNPGNIQVIPIGLSSGTAELSLFIPIVDEKPLTGWASLNPDNLPGAARHIARPSHVATLDSFGLDQVTFVKIDVEGHELEVLRGGEQTLARWRPMLLIEVKPRNAASVDQFLAKLGYQRHALSDLLGIPGSPENAIFAVADATGSHNAR